jgi:hypothetical protein
MILVLNALTPVFLLILLGLILRNRAFLSEATFGQLRRFIFWIAFPALLFSKIAGTSFDLGPVIVQIGFLFGVHLAGLLVALLLSAVLRIPRRMAPTFVQGAFRGNLAFIGLPIISYGLAGVDSRFAVVEAQMYLILAAMIPFFNVAAVLLFAAGGERKGDHPVHDTILSIMKNPLIVACVLGLLFSVLKIPLPSPVWKSLRLLGSIALPLALITIGASMRFHKLRGMLSYTLGAALFKTLLLPLFGYLALFLFSSESGINPALFVLLACPTAVSSYILADQMEGDAQLAGNIVVVSTAVSFVPISVVLMTIQHSI